MANFYYKVTFVSCCDQTAVELQILTSQINGGLYLTQGGTYLYEGVTGDLINNQCYTYTVDTSVNVNGFNAAPPVTDFSGLEVSCQDQVCQNCGGDCECPPGYTPLPDNSACFKENIIPPTLPINPLFAGNNNEGGNVDGFLLFDSLNNYIWPLLTVPQASTLTAYSVIPNPGSNPLTGDNWTNIIPASQMDGKHSGVFTPTFSVPYPNPNPLGLPVNNSGSVTSRPYPIYQSAIVGTDLNLGQGSEVLPVNYLPISAITPLTPLWNYIVPNSVWNYYPTDPVENQWSGFSTCVNPQQETTYLIMITGNNGLRLFIDDVLAVEMLNGSGYTQAMAFGNIFPITLPAGLHGVRLEAYNYTLGGSLTCDIFDCTYAQLISANQSQLESYRVFSSFWKRSRAMTLTATGTDIVTTSASTQPYDVSGFFDSPGFPVNAYVIEVIDSTTYRFNQNISAGSYTGNLRFLFTANSIDSQSFTCPEGYTFNGCDCVGILEEPCIAQPPIYYTLNDCCTLEPIEYNGEVIYLSYNIGDCFAPGTCPEDIGSSIITTIINEAQVDLSGCLQLTEIVELPPGAVSSSYPSIMQEITTVPTCDDCQSCFNYYNLVDCCTQLPLEIDGEVAVLRFDPNDPTECGPGYCPDDIGTQAITKLVINEIILEGCWRLIPTDNLGNRPINYPNVINAQTEFVAGCQECNCNPCYKLTNCSIEGTPPIFVSNDLSQYVGKSIYLCPENFPSNPTPPTDPGVPFIIPDDTPQYKGTLTNCCDPTDKRYISNNFLSFPTTGSIVIPNIDSPSGGSTTCWTYKKEDLVGQTYVFANLTGALFYENCILCNQQNPCVVYPIVEECYCYLVEESEECENTINLTLPLVIEEYNDCLACRSQKEPKCYLLVDCADNDNTIIVNNDFEDYVGKVIKIKYCDIYWSVFESPTCLNSITVADFAEEFDACPAPPPEPELTLKPRAITPGYKTPACTPEYTEKVNCSFANQAFDKMASIRYGINSCCEEDFDYWDVKKRLLELDEIKDNFIIK